MMDRLLDWMDEVVELAWYRLVWMFRVCVILGVLAGGVGYVVFGGLPFPEWLRVQIVIGSGPEGLVGPAARDVEAGRDRCGPREERSRNIGGVSQ